MVSMMKPRRIGLSRPASMMELNRRPMARPDWAGFVRSDIITIDSGWVMPNPRPNIDIRMVNPATEAVDGIKPTARMMASMEYARIFLRSNISSRGRCSDKRWRNIRAFNGWWRRYIILRVAL